MRPHTRLAFKEARIDAASLRFGASQGRVLCGRGLRLVIGIALELACALTPARRRAPRGVTLCCVDVGVCAGRVALRAALDIGGHQARGGVHKTEVPGVGLRLGVF